jgi:hypothetical protein
MRAPALVLATVSGLALLSALPKAEAVTLVESVGGVTDNTPCAVLIRPLNTTAYSANDLIANNVTAGSVQVPTCTVAREVGFGGAIPRFRLTTNVTTGWDGALLKVRFWTAAPTYTNGDNGAYAVATGAAGYMGKIIITLEQFGDGASGVGAPEVGSFIAFKLAAGQVIYWDIQETSGALTPISGQTFTLTPENMQD